MTSGPASEPIKSFQDVLDEGYGVTVMADSSNSMLLANSEPGSPMHRVYTERMLAAPDASFFPSSTAAVAGAKAARETLFFGNNLYDAADPNWCRWTSRRRRPTTTRSASRRTPS